MGRKLYLRMDSFMHKHGLRAALAADEETLVRGLFHQLDWSEEQRARVQRPALAGEGTTPVGGLFPPLDWRGGQRARAQRRARHFVERIRAGRRAQGGLDIFLSEYDLSTEEGVALMCLAEALLRVPDAGTV